MRTITLETPTEKFNYEKRTAVRCLIIKDGQICIIHDEKGNYYKLPGGGIEPEDPNDAIACQREALEETGCEVDVRPELIAEVTEYRGTLHQENHAYICTIRKDKGKVELTELEASEGLVHLWCPVAGALQKMNAIEPTSRLAEFIKKRDIFLVEAYLQTFYMSSQM